MLESSTIKALVDDRDFIQLRRIFKEAEDADLGEVLTSIDIEEGLVLFRLVPSSKRPTVFAYLPNDRQQRFLESLPDIVVTVLLNDMAPDDRTKLLEDMPEDMRTQILMRLSPEERRQAFELLSYPENSVGRLMNPEFLALREDMTVRQALEYIRWSAEYPEEMVHHAFVVDTKGHYLGDVSLSGLVLADTDRLTVGSLMQTRATALNVKDDQEKAVDFVRKYDRSYVPVVDDLGILEGILTSDDVFDVAEEEASEDIQQFGGHSALEHSYFLTPLKSLIRKRAGWLCVIFVGELFTGTALRHYDSEIANMRFLVYFIPLILSSGGNSGSQAASLIIRGLAVKEIDPKDWLRVVGRETVAGLMLGLILGVIGFVRAMTWGNTVAVGIMVGCALVGVVMLGSIIGSMLPMLFKRLNMDPAVSSSPFIASLVDVVGIVMLFEIAHLMVTHFAVKI